ncbi:hypothetical protein CO676_19800 [Sinorhizobium sp. BJ1]|nr:hypothetical protein CO676_19800 [Sinorhizobium sp. BJ1]
MRDIAVPVSILLGFAMLSSAIHTKENDFQTCVRMLDKALAPDVGGEKRDLVLATECKSK